MTQAHYRPIPHDCYLHVAHMTTGQEWIVEIKGNMTLGLEKRVDDFLKKQFGGELKRDGDIYRRLEGEYYAKVLTDNRQPEDSVCWDGGGFFVKHYEDVATKPKGKEYIW